MQKADENHSCNNLGVEVMISGGKEERADVKSRSRKGFSLLVLKTSSTREGRRRDNWSGGIKGSGERDEGASK